VAKTKESAIAASLRNRIVGSGEENPAKILANPKNWRQHGDEQADAMDATLSEIGWVQSVIVNKRTGRLVDGHLRVDLAKKRGEKKIPVVYVDLSPQEEDQVLATLDPLGDIAGRDPARLEKLLKDLDPKSVALQSFIGKLEADLGIGSNGAADGEEEVLLDQAVQLEPGKEFVVVMCDKDQEWDELKKRLDLRTVRRGGYKRGSPFDATGTQRVIRAADLLKRLGRK
jgi:ParB-like chromosome segregation protein Spo0J